MRTETEAADDSMYYVAQLIHSLEDMGGSEELIAEAEKLRESIREEL